MLDQKFIQAMSTCQEEEVLGMIKAKLDRGDPIQGILDDMAEGLRLLGENFSCGQAFIPELVYGGEIFNKCVEMIKPKINQESEAVIEKKGKVLVATVKGDLHDIGKNLVATFLNIGGYDVIDSGHDVSNEKLIEEIEKQKPDVVGLSALLTTTMFNQREFIKLLKEKGMREEVKVIVGGAPVTQGWANEIGADAFGADAVDGKEKIDILLGR